MKAKKRKSFEHQVEIQKELQSKGYNIVQCNMCGCVHIYRKPKKKAICYDCGEEIYFNECSDLFY